MLKLPQIQVLPLGCTERKYLYTKTIIINVISNVIWCIPFLDSFEFFAFVEFVINLNDHVKQCSINLSYIQEFINKGIKNKNIVFI